jgi:hypothetical protein
MEKYERVVVRMTVERDMRYLEVQLPLPPLA